jgi:hypothetical protein
MCQMIAYLPPRRPPPTTGYLMWAPTRGIICSGQMGEPSLGGDLLATTIDLLEELPDSRSRTYGAGQGRPTKQQVGAGRRKPRPDYNRNRKYSRRCLLGAGKGRTGGVRAHQRSWQHGRLGERATGSKASGPGSAVGPRVLFCGIRSRRSGDDKAGSHPAGQELPSLAGILSWGVV